MKTKLLSKIRKKYYIMKPNGITLQWTAWDKESISPYWVSKDKTIEVFLFRLLFDLLSESKANKIVFKKHKRYLRYSKCLFYNYA